MCKQFIVKPCWNFPVKAAICNETQNQSNLLCPALKGNISALLPDLSNSHYYRNLWHENTLFVFIENSIKLRQQTPQNVWQNPNFTLMIHKQTPSNYYLSVCRTCRMDDLFLCVVVTCWNSCILVDLVGALAEQCKFWEYRLRLGHWRSPAPRVTGKPLARPYCWISLQGRLSKDVRTLQRRRWFI